MCILLSREILCFKDFVERAKAIPDLQWDPRRKPKLLFDPYSEDRDFVAHYFLIVASIDEGSVVGPAINAKLVVHELYKELGTGSLSRELEER